MATVAFPAAFEPLIDRRSAFSVEGKTKVDVVADGSPRIRTVRATEYTTVVVQLRHLELSEHDTLVAFLKTNQANTVTMSIDGTDYSGVIRPAGRRLYGKTMSGNRFNITFSYYAKVV